MTKQPLYSVIGSGAWGTALASLTCKLGYETVLYGRDPATVDLINQLHRNPVYLPGVSLPASLTASNEIERALQHATRLIIVVPAQAMAGVLSEIAAYAPKTMAILLGSKGIDQRTGQFMSQLAKSVLPNHDVAVLSGPSFAADVAHGLPTALTIASNTVELAKQLTAELSGTALRCYASDDLIGVELGGALKNVLAIGAGIVRGKKLGASAEAALITRGFSELRRLGTALGAKRQTLTGLAVFGDLILTCSSPQSRNFSYGLALGAGHKTQGLKLAEGVATAPMAASLCDDHGIEAPVIQTINAILSGHIDIDSAAKRLISRPLKLED